MTQFKDKAGSQRELVSAGLFFYPVLQAADVLAYRANEVPVGEDQRQHVELMRDVAERFNARFGETLVVPEVAIPEVGARIMDLQFPDSKMSTTGGSPQGTVLVLDEPDAIVKKFRSAVTDSGYRGRARPRQGRDLEPDRDPRRGPRHRARGGRARVRGSGYGAFKQAVADAVVEYLAPVRERYQELRADEAGARADLAEGAEKARAIAADTLRRRPRGDGRRTGPAPTVSLPVDADRRPRARPRRFRRALRPAADADPARGDRSARGRPGRGRDRLHRPPRAAGASSIWRRRPSSWC